MLTSRDLTPSYARLPGTHLLVVEDDPGLRRVVAQGLARAGYLVEVAPDGRQALEHAQTGRPDGLILDVMLPDAHGLDLAQQIRSTSGLEAVPVLFVTALPPATVRDTLFPAPVLFKPFTYRQLVASVRALLRPCSLAA